MGVKSLDHFSALDAGHDGHFHLVHDIGEGDAVFRVAEGMASAGSGVAEGGGGGAVELLGFRATFF